MRSWRTLLFPLLLVAMGGCGGGNGDAEARATVDSVALARQAFDTAAFDTITWAADSAATNRGQIVFMYSCRKCHGEGGRGDGGFVMNGDTLRPPSFLAPDWRFANDRAALRAYIFAGNEKGMPHWGLVGLKAKDIDAVARYIQEVLRKGI